MTLTNTFLNETIKLVVGVEMTPPSHIAFSSTVIDMNPASTTLVGEYGPRSETNNTHSLNEATFSAIRSGALPGSSGDTINSFGLLSSSSDGLLYAQGLVSSLLHTSDFDVEVEWRIRLDRR